MQNSKPLNRLRSSVRVPRTLWTLFWLVSISALFSSNVILAKYSAGKAAPFGMAFWRWFITALVLRYISRGELTRKGRAIFLFWPKAVLASWLGMGLCGAPIYIAAASTSATNIGIIMAASPILILLLSASNSHGAVKWHALIGLCLSVFGVLVVLAKGSLRRLAEISFIKGDLIVLLSMVAWSGYTLIQNVDIGGLSITAKVGIFSLIGAFINLPFYMCELVSGHANTSAFWEVVHLYYSRAISRTIGVLGLRKAMREYRIGICVFTYVYSPGHQFFASEHSLERKTVPLAFGWRNYSACGDRFVSNEILGAYLRLKHSLGCGVF